MAEGGMEDLSLALPEIFERAANHIRNLVANLESRQLLELYAYYKQAKEGPCNAPRPYWYELQAKQKWDAWNALGDMDQETAMKHYITVITEIDPDWDYIQSEESNAASYKGTAGWVSVSCMSNTDDFLADNDKTIFDWVKEGNIDKVLEYAKSSNGVKFVNIPDAEGMGLIHWAADRGNIMLLKCLVSDLKADINLKDEDGQTALHYAASCGHADVVNYLLNCGADPNIRDGDGLLPVDVATDGEVEKAFRTFTMSV
ncbi:acyl-CoA-binding domain-containing protein 6 [Anabrus simplex]|uniref:acyl-CoA-binding domain-containing protein 6 n=1 Tax=Anabrus simplex TaxID=316456 RepID=UPI0034DD3098